MLYCKKTSTKVVPKEVLFDVIQRGHEGEGLAGQDKTGAEIRSNYSWVRQEAIKSYQTENYAWTA